MKTTETTETPETTITLTPAASAKVTELVAEDDSLAGEEFVALRVVVAGGGCSGFQYQLGFDTERQDDDLAFEHDGVTLLVDSVSAGYLAGAEVDFQDGLQGKGFAINNPNSTGSCGCGQSFSC